MLLVLADINNKTASHALMNRPPKIIASPNHRRFASEPRLATSASRRRSNQKHRPLRHRWSKIGKKNPLNELTKRTERWWKMSDFWQWTFLQIQLLLCFDVVSSCKNFRSKESCFHDFPLHKWQCPKLIRSHLGRSEPVEREEVSTNGQKNPGGLIKV